VPRISVLLNNGGVIGRIDLPAKSFTGGSNNSAHDRVLPKSKFPSAPRTTAAQSCAYVFLSRIALPSPRVHPHERALAPLWNSVHTHAAAGERQIMRASVWLCVRLREVRARPCDWRQGGEVGRDKARPGKWGSAGGSGTGDTRA
jgi:hypothetical protein